VPADSARKCIWYFQISSYFHKFYDLMVNVKSQDINASAGAVGSCSTFYKHFKFLLCNFCLTLLTCYPLGGAAVVW